MISEFKMSWQQYVDDQLLATKQVQIILLKLFLIIIAIDFRFFIFITIILNIVSIIFIIDRQVKEAVILGHDGNVWAASQDFSVNTKNIFFTITITITIIITIIAIIAIR